MSEETIFYCQFGSHIYGTNLATSDLDYKKIYLPCADDILLQRVSASRNEGTKANKTAKNSADDTDIEAFSLQKYIKLLLDGQTVAIGMLFTPAQWLQAKAHPAWHEIQENRHEFLHSGVSAYVGYCRQQANKYGIKGSRVSAVRNILTVLNNLSQEHGHLTKLSAVWDDIERYVATNEHCAIILADPAGNSRNIARMLDVCNRKTQEFITIKEAISIYQHLFDEYGHRALAAEKEQGIDWKALMHAVRVSEEAKELLLTGIVTYPRPEASLLLKIRQGHLPYKQVAEIIEEGLINIEQASLISILPKKPNIELSEAIIKKWYRQQVV